MALRLLSYIDLPAHRAPGGFDHAAIHRASRRLYVAHTANDALDVIDCGSDCFVRSIPNLAGVAGVLASDEHNRIFTSNRGEDTVGILSPDDASMLKVPVGVRPNGLAYAPTDHLLLAANVGHPQEPGSFTVSLVDVGKNVRLTDLAVPGRTRWTVYDAQADAFYVNISDPAQIVVIEAGSPTQIARTFPVPAAGPHGLALDAEHHRLFCACDGKQLVCLETRGGAILNELEFDGAPDVIFLNPALRHLYVAIGDPGVIEVFDTQALRRIETIWTEKGAHTLAFDAGRNKVYAFLPGTHRAAVYLDHD